MGKRNQVAPFAFDLDASDIAAEKRKARELRSSQWWKRQCAKGCCYWCGQTVPAKALTMDHIIPISRGGKTSRNNVVPSCETCNNHKKQMLPIEWEAHVQKLRSMAKGEGDEQRP